ncbi:MAG: hypothetical protein A2V70_18460 [Planctomycetes bacterium RBG_13_63_9]|nr:MAG: hypothetical protein A2V70_18460 [Planctomycetes bacterium RBG_13_63_9]
MQVFCLRDLDELAPYADDWDRLSAGVPFRSWTWLSAWWRNYGGGHFEQQTRRRLFVPCVFDDTDALVALAPWYLEAGGPQGRVVRPLGSGEVCSDYLTVLCQPAMQCQVTQTLADYLTENPPADDPSRQPWDLLQLSGIDAQDRVIDQLLRHLAADGNTVHRRPGPNCWRIDLPPTWDDYLAMLSKGHRKQLRRLERRLLATGRAVLHEVQRLDQLPHAVEILVDLHQRRRHAQGQRGCFASPRFAAFCQEVLPDLLRNGQLRLDWLELDGRPVAIEYKLAGGGVLYAYQGGVEPDAMEHEPGKLIAMANLRQAIEGGYRAFDFLRGDEFYKPHFRAKPRPSLAVRVVPSRASAQLRHNVWLAGDNVKQWVRSGLKRVAARGD